MDRKLQADKSGYLSIAPANLDVEIREIWQPWLKSKCNFAVRYIVPDRVNIIKILESQNRFSAEVNLILVLTLYLYEFYLSIHLFAATI